MDARLARRYGLPAEPVTTVAAATEGLFRQDLERIRFSPYFARLAAVTQVISQNAATQVVHNRLTHSIKVTAVARAIATALRDSTDRTALDQLGGCDPVVVQAAASAHDLGHPPFGHLGERVLDELARERFGLVDGFEGNAQTFRILTSLDVHGSNYAGLNLTAAVRAAVLKYPWARVAFPTPHPATSHPAPRGAGPGNAGMGSLKFSAYLVDVPEMAQVRAAYPQLLAWQQTPECAVMDIADDIAYSLHDLDDFHRSGVLQHALVAAEFRNWLRRRAEFARIDRHELQALARQPGYSLELLRRRLREKDGWILSDDVFATAVGRVGEELVDGLLAVPFDASMGAERAIEQFTASWIEHLQDSVIVTEKAPVRAAHVMLSRQAWHEVTVLKFVHQRFVLDRPDLALIQRGQARVLKNLVNALDSWLSDRADASRAPRRLLDLLDLAHDSYRALAAAAPEFLLDQTGEPLRDNSAVARLARGRAIIDYVASLTDDQAVSTAGALRGHAGQLFAGGSL